MRIGLCLSGGGFRATFFHLGVLRFLQQEESLKDVTHICSVSGGSILAAHVVQHWHEYTRDLASFESASEEIVRFAKIDLRGRVVRRWLLSSILPFIRFLPAPTWKRTAVLQRFYNSRLYRNAKLNALAGDGGTSAVPDLHILAPASPR